MTDRLEHPRAAVEGQNPPSRVATDAGRVPVDEDGYFDASEASEAWRSRFASAYGVTWADDGSVEAVEAGSSGPDPRGLDAGEWSEEAWLGVDYEERADMVRSGDVDAHLEAIAECETSSTVEEAVDERQAALEE